VRSRLSRGRDMLRYLMDMKGRAPRAEGEAAETEQPAAA